MNVQGATMGNHWSVKHTISSQGLTCGEVN